ncbi:MAG TPA: VWA domain-containing protein [Terriglobia bacterium]|nr:VWA domain-containing protein [Terriglobia bacterium]
MKKTLISALLIAGLLLPGAAVSQKFTLRTETEVVLVNVSVRDKDGNFVRDLKKEDFTISEDGKPQEIVSLDIENTDSVVTAEPPPASGLLGALRAPNASTAAPTAQPSPASEIDLKDRRLIILFFDLSSMQPEEVERAAKSALDYVDKQMSPADIVSVVSLSNSLSVNLDFTADRKALKNVLQHFDAGSGQGFELGDTGDADGTPDTGAAFTADETEYNIFNTDRRLQALRSIADSLARVQQRKSLLYFSSGAQRTGIENQSELRAAVNAAVRANLAIYSVDIRGLQAIVPGGEARNASLRGTSVYSGQAMMKSYDSNFASQETLVTLAADTGGRAFLDTNDFQPAFSRMHEDTSFYYLLGYHSSNPARDGRFRRITVQVRNRPGLTLDFRRGYYAASDFQHSTKEDRERQLQEQLQSDLPSTDFPVYLSAGYFRFADNRYFMPVSVVVPGSQIPFTRNSQQDRATLDLIAVVRDESKRPFGSIRDTVRLAVNTSQEVQRKNVQYDSAFLLPPGKYTLKFVVRENQTGRMGSFETAIGIPDLKSAPVKVSSIIVSNQKQPARQKNNPLVREGSEIVPNVTHVFAQNQHLFFYYEVYDPATPAEAAQKSSTRILTNIAFYRGAVKAYETPVVEADQINIPDRKATGFELDVPLDSLKPGFYTCQINIIDDAAGKFVFPRLALLIR